MEILLFRAALAPSMVLLASVVARRLGPRRGGRLLGAPTTTGPFLALVCWDAGRSAGAEAAQGSVAGQLVVACFCLAYGRLAPRLLPWRTLARALLAAAAAGAVGVALGDVWLTAAVTVAVVLAGLWTWRVTSDSVPVRQAARAWETPLRMALATGTVLAAMAGARLLGSYVGGVLSTLPVLLAVMAPTVHRSGGARAAAELTRGALLSAAATCCFLLTLATALPAHGPLLAFPLALVALVASGWVLNVVVARRTRGSSLVVRRGGVMGAARGSGGVPSAR
ncbi:hypothetical protein [Streptomyces sp. ODS28]|uniref:hypothetical protein n=1 Tax=Streptomyces sp. ODS28 TaxID=3136688 RepID=UPI0031E76D99